ncbi:MAG: radical SAM protein [Patescibacteria group bacterium]
MAKTLKNDKFWLSISTRCNNQCLFCHDKENQVNGRFFTLAEVQDKIEQAKKEGYKRLILSGGEASINPDFLKIVRYAHDLGFKEIQTITNGRYFYYSKFAAEAIKAGLTEITFSLHGHNEELHEEFTGVKGSFQQALTGLANVRKYPQIIVNIDIVINKLNYPKLYDIIQFYAQNFGVYEFDLLQVVPFGQAWENRDKLFYDFNDALPYLNKVWELAKNDQRFHIWTNRFPAQYLEGYEFLIQDPYKYFDDVLGRKKMFAEFINENKLMPCFNPERCKSCNLNDFCQKLINLTKGDLSDKLMKLTMPPVCLDLPRDNYEINFLNAQGRINLEKFVDFYINNLYNLKSLRCDDCNKFKDCNGLNINLIKEKGFKVLKPIS